jgi:5-methylthioadenosine/S-adenosylhomocysteine deaminase
LNGAKAVGLGDRVGSLVVGKHADIVAVRLDAIETEPVYNPISQLVYATGRHQVSDVWIAGVRKLQSGALVGIDLDGLRDKARSWRARIG